MQKFSVKNILFFIFLVIIHDLSHAQHSPQREIDSLKKVVKTQKNDTNEVNTLNNLSHTLERIGNYDSALVYAKHAQALTQKIGFKMGLAGAFINIGNIYFDQGNYSKALEYQTKALAISQELGDKNGKARHHLCAGSKDQGWRALGTVPFERSDQGENPAAFRIP